jgi:hypothetical protein
MHSADLLGYISVNIEFTFYINEFPATAPDDCGVVRITGGARPSSNLSEPTFQVLIRAGHPATAEAKAWEVYQLFNYKRAFNVGDTHVILCNAMQSSPVFIGTDDNGRYIYSLNFRNITEVL